MTEEEFIKLYGREYDYEYDHKLCENDYDLFEERYMEYCETLAMQLEDMNVLYHGDAKID